jgi:hypothetical protein
VGFRASYIAQLNTRPEPFGRGGSVVLSVRGLQESVHGELTSLQFAQIAA